MAGRLKYPIWVAYRMALAAAILLATNTVTGDSATKKEYRVSSIVSPPYLMENTNRSVNATGNDLYIGFVKDVLDALSDVGDFTYKIQLVNDSRYGAENPDGTWSGMVGEVHRGEADIAGPLIVTLHREKALDFTYPLMKLDAVVVMSIRDENREPKIHSLEDLVNQDVVKYGVLKGGPIDRQLKQSQNPLHKKMWQKLQDNADWYRDNNNDGVEDARASYEYAFILEGTTASWLVNQEPCNLEMIESTGIYRRQYALAFKENSQKDRETMNEHIVELESRNVLNELEDKWWGGVCTSATSRAALSLTLLSCLTLLLTAMFS